MLWWACRLHKRSLRRERGTFNFILKWRDDVCTWENTLTFVTLCAVGDKSLNEHIPHCLIDQNVFDYFVALARVAGVQTNSIYVGLHGRIFHICVGA